MQKKIKTDQKQPHTQVGELRDLLATIENRIAKLGELSPNDALEILLMLDQATEKVAYLEKVGGSISSEATQLESILRQFNAKRVAFCGKVGGAALQKTREDYQPDESNWWWFLDEAIAKERQALIKRWTLGIVIVGVVLTTIVLIYRQFFAPDPVFQAGIGFQQTAENVFILGDYEQALENVDQAIERLPNAPELLVMRGVIYETLEEPELAQADYEMAKRMFEKEDTFFSTRAKFYLMAGQAELAILDAETALAINPDSAISYIYLGQAHELLGDFAKAVEYYEIASDVAERNGNATLQVMARMQLATLLQQNQILTTTKTP